MSYDESDAAADAAWDYYSEVLYPEHFERAVEEFTTDRLQSYYIDNRDVAGPALSALEEARALLTAHSTASAVFAATALELGIKMVVLKPITYGLIHNGELATFVADFLMSLRPSFEKLRDICLKILSEHGGVDLHAHRRTPSSPALWAEIKSVQNLRNDFLHKGRVATSSEALTAVAVAGEFLDTIVPRLLTKLNLHLGNQRLISKDTGWRIWSAGLFRGPKSQSYKLLNGQLFGLCAGGQYFFDNSGRLQGPGTTGEFYLTETRRPRLLYRLYGPAHSLPWISALESLHAELLTWRDSFRVTGGTRPFLDLVKDLFLNHAISCNEQLLASNDRSLVVILDGVETRAVALDVHRLDVSELEDMATSSGTPLLVFSPHRHIDTAERSSPEKPPIALVTARDLEHLLETRRGSFVDQLRSKLDFAQTYRNIYMPP